MPHPAMHRSPCTTSFSHIAKCRTDQVGATLVRALPGMCLQVQQLVGASKRATPRRTWWMGRGLPHCSTVFAKSSGIVMLAAVAPACKTGEVLRIVPPRSSRYHPS